MTIGFVDQNGNPISNVDANTYSIVMQAAYDWDQSLASTTTKIRIAPFLSDPGLPSELNLPDIQVQLTDDAQADQCAALENDNARLYYGPSMQNLIASSVAGHDLRLPTAIFAHEIGHGLGLDDAGPSPNPPTIMNNGPTCGPPKIPHYVISQTDQIPADEFGYSCTYTYGLVDYYMNGDYEYSEEVLESTTCPIM